MFLRAVSTVLTPVQNSYELLLSPRSADLFASVCQQAHSTGHPVCRQGLTWSHRSVIEAEPDADGSIRLQSLEVGPTWRPLTGNDTAILGTLSRHGCVVGNTT